jgi:hypothetical protein
MHPDVKFECWPISMVEKRVDDGELPINIFALFETSVVLLEHFLAQKKSM